MRLFRVVFTSLGIAAAIALLAVTLYPILWTVQVWDITCVGADGNVMALKKYRLSEEQQKHFVAAAERFGRKCTAVPVERRFIWEC